MITVKEIELIEFNPFERKPDHKSWFVHSFLFVVFYFSGFILGFLSK